MRAAILFVALLAGCNSKDKKVKEILEKNRPEVESKLKAIESLAAKELPEATGKLTYTGPSLKDAALGGTCEVLSREAAKTITNLPTVNPDDGVFGISFELGQVARALKSGVPSYWNETSAQTNLSRVTKLTHVLIIRKVGYMKPMMPANGQGTPGSYTGEAHLFDLAGKHYGGLVFAARSSATVKFTREVDKKSGKELSNNAGSAADQDLDSNTKQALQKAVAEQIPGFELRTL
jgi:hypothetical protein